MKKVIVLSVVILFAVSMAWAQEKCEAPVWNVGDRWNYELTKGNTETREVVDISNDLFIVKIEGTQYLSAYDRKTMNLKNFINNTGKQVKAESATRNLYDFPIWVNKKWSDTTVSKPAGTNQVRTYENEFKIVGTELVTTPAGKFECYKIYRTQTSMDSASKPSGVARYWYSPEVKALVKWEFDMSSFYWQGVSATKAELISYKIK